MPVSRSSNLPRLTRRRLATTATCVLSIHSAIYRVRTSTSFERCSKGRPLGSGVCACDESLLDMSLCCLTVTVSSSFHTPSTFMYNFEDGYHDSYSRVINEAPEAPVSVVIASLRTRYRPIPWCVCDEVKFGMAISYPSRDWVSRVDVLPLGRADVLRSAVCQRPPHPHRHPGSCSVTAQP
ncbi:hypothetical protein BDY19DRAFT_707534 [Irpex rosettiformis]|uniref:Uncharacterized protein n=1 Tax=Irpex rosettiformis TaxID=378272 RepID=A0ACB8TMV6_9APHY|nr:hypothetical protein BDY19DRAFT_707534 [Irpex rosettiformis]